MATLSDSEAILTCHFDLEMTPLQRSDGTTRASKSMNQNVSMSCSTMMYFLSSNPISWVPSTWKTNIKTRDLVERYLLEFCSSSMGGGEAGFWFPQPDYKLCIEVCLCLRYSFTLVIYIFLILFSWGWDSRTG